MAGVWSEVDRLLRGEHTRADALRDGRLAVSTRTLIVAILLLGGLYGACMGLYAVCYNRPEGLWQLLVTIVKVPLLFLLTLAVTYPSLYVYSALSQSRLRFGETLRLLLASTTVTLAVLASLGPVTAFFTLSTRSHPFMQSLNALFFAVAGCIGLAFLWRALRGVFGEEADSARAVPARGRRVAFVWLLTYAVVGAQMGWILRPFIGKPGLPFEWLRGTESDIFHGLLEALRYALA
jgi:hypothetical protein